VNVSPKGCADTFAVLDDRTVGRLDLTGSGAETAAQRTAVSRPVLLVRAPPACCGRTAPDASLPWLPAVAGSGPPLPR